GPGMEVIRQLHVWEPLGLGALRGPDHLARAVLLARDPEAEFHERSACTRRARCGEWSTRIASGLRVAGTPISPPPVRKWKPEYIPAYLSNGLVGVRAGKCPLTEGLAIVSGLAAIHATDKVEGFACGPYTLAGETN